MFLKLLRLYAKSDDPSAAGGAGGEFPTGMPDDRFNGKKKVLGPDELGGAGSNPSNPAGDPEPQPAKSAKMLKSKIKIKPEATVEILDGKQVGGVPLETSYVTRSVAGTSAISAADDMSKTTYTKGNYRPSTRYGKKRSDELLEFDNTVCEQVVPIVEDSLDLREAPQAKQGYNGRKQFKEARAKKNVASLPQHLLQDASVDFVVDDYKIATHGQMLDGIEPQADYPTVNGAGETILEANRMKKSNYEPQAMVIKARNGHITSIRFLEKQFVVKADPVTRDEANMNWQVDANNVAKAMIRLQTELGRETTEKWSPLGYVIYQGYEYNMLMHDIEAHLGALAALAIRAAISSIAAQWNIQSKDGISPKASAIRMFLEDFAGELKSSDIVPDGDFSRFVFNKEFYKQGSAAAIIAMFDSTTKYRSKADLLMLQRSLTLHLAKAQNNIAPFHVKPNFLKALDKAHVFSTDDGTYNPRLQINATKKMKVISPISLDFFVKDWKNPALFTDEDRQDTLRDQTTGTKATYWYQYKDLRVPYTTRVQHPLIEGLILWLLKNEGSFVHTYGGEGNEEVTINIPTHFDFTNPGMFEFMICSASQQIAWERNITYRDILFAGEQSTYIWDDLVSLSKMDPLHSTQLSIKGYNTALGLGKLAQDTALRIYWNDTMTFLGHTSAGGGGDKYEYILPWFFNEKSFTGGTNPYTQNEGFRNESNAFNMTIPSIRDGVRHEHVDIIKSMDERTIRLALDRMVTIPVFDVLTPSNNGAYGVQKYEPVSDSTTLNNYVRLAALRYENVSDGRVIVQYDLTAGANRKFTENALYCVPKELGWLWPGASDDVKVITGISWDDEHNKPVITYATTNPGATYDGSRSTRIISYRVKANALSNKAIERSAALTQVYYQCFALRDVASLNQEYTTKTGLAPSMSYNNGQPEDVDCVYNIDSDNASTNVTVVTQLKTSARTQWTKIQRFFYPVNPFENAYIESLDGATNGTTFDPLDGAFTFGVCGTLASEYAQDVLERLDAKDQLGMDYIEDVFAKDSLLLH